MPKGVLALTTDGRVTYCVAPPEMRGKGRCNHVAHQEEGQSPEDFINSINSKIASEDDNVVDQTEGIKRLINIYTDTNNPKWDEMISNMPTPFCIGSKEDGTYEEADLISIDQNFENNGDDIRLVAHYIFRGKEYELDYGTIPAMHEDGTININGVPWRVLPVLEQYKAGVISSSSKIIIKQDDGNLAIVIPKENDPENPYAIIRGKNVLISDIQKYYETRDDSGIDSGQKWSLDHLDEAVEQRFPDFKKNPYALVDLPEDQPGDLEWRRCIRYQDIVENQYKLQARRMGVTFRTNLNKQNKAIENGMSEEEANERYPLFYQKNLSDNIKDDLIGRSNVQSAQNLNPIAALSQAEKISLTGPGGYNKDAAPFELRMPHNSHEGVIDSMDVSSGKNVGLTLTLSNGYIGDDRYIHKKEGGLSPSDFIPFKTHNDPNRAIMAVAHMKQACPITGGEDPIVKTPAWDNISGAKLGVNLRVAYIPSDGVFEDAVIISESAANKMTTIQSQNYKCRKPHGLKVGDKVERKQVIGGETIKIGGTIKSVSHDGFEVETVYKMAPGDKLAGRHGNKSVVSRVVPDNEMPKVYENGELKHADLIMSPMSVVGRKNLGQVLECNTTTGKGENVNATSTVLLNDGHKIEATSGLQYIMRLNHIGEKKLASHANEMDSKKESEGSRLGEMESLLLTRSPERRKILHYLRNQEAQDSHNKLHSLLKSIGVDMTGVNWDD